MMVRRSAGLALYVAAFHFLEEVLAHHHEQAAGVLHQEAFVESHVLVVRACDTLP